MATNATPNETALFSKGKPNPSQFDRRQPWHRPEVRILALRDSETGVNSTTDFSNTFS